MGQVMIRTVEQIEADIQAIKANPNWASNEAALNAIAAFTIEKNQVPRQTKIAVTSNSLLVYPQAGAATFDYTSWPYFSSKLNRIGLSHPVEQYCLYGTILIALGASRKPFMKAYWLNKYLHEQDESARKMLAGRGNFTRYQLETGAEYLKELRRTPRRWALLPLSFIAVESILIAFKRVRIKFYDSNF